MRDFVERLMAVAIGGLVFSGVNAAVVLTLHYAVDGRFHLSQFEIGLILGYGFGLSVAIVNHEI